MADEAGYGRADLRRLAEAKLGDARYLHAGGRHSSAYFIAGYAVEFALKACIARRYRAETIPSPDLGKHVYSHQIKDLQRLAGLSDTIRASLQADPDLKSAWLAVLEWSVDVRYEDVDPERAERLLTAVERVLEWFRRYW